jgi:hypothetical protein
VNERHYRKLLAWYPRDHRARHGDEMLGVLLAGEGPSRRETVDLLRGALLLHLRRMLGMDGGIDHRDVLAIVSLLGPIVMLAGSAEVLNRLAAYAQGASTSLRTVFTFEIPEAPVWAVWFMVAVLSLFRMRRTGAVGAWLGTIGLLPVPWRGYVMSYEVFDNAGWMLLGAVVAIALTWSPGPARGWELVGRGRVVVLAAAVGVCVALVVKSLNTYSVLHYPVGPVMSHYGAARVAAWGIALVLLVAGALVASGARTREGRRAALVLSVPVVVVALMVVLPRSSDFMLASAVCYGVPVVLLLAFGGLPRRRVRSTG